MDYDNLSTTAKAVCGAWFGMMRPHKGELTFELGQAKPSPQAQEGLDELVRARIIHVEPFNEYGGLVYRALVDCHWAFVWLMKNQNDPVAKVRMTVPIESREDAAQHQRAALAVTPE